MTITLDELPPVMVKRAIWAREHILNNIGIIEIDEDEMLAWVYNTEDDLWYSIAGNYSKSSPTQKKKKRSAWVEKQKKYKEDSAKKYADEEEYIKYYSKIRQRVLDRDNNTCQKCGVKIETFHVHHIVPRGKGGENYFDNLITVCGKCHPTVEKFSREETRG